jgi:hypothetical protein
VPGTKYLETGLTNKEDFPEKVKNEHIEGIFIPVQRLFSHPRR